MGLSIITPHYNDFDGLKSLYSCLLHQSKKDWEWLIVDDFSDASVLTQIGEWINYSNDSRVQFRENNVKSNASVCRNIGAKLASFNTIVFVDADDVISTVFVENRAIEVENFAIFLNSAVIDEHNETHEKVVPRIDYLNAFLSAKFLWPITSIVWNKRFFDKVGGFDERLPRLQDVELVIRVLQKEIRFIESNNSIDFFYNVKPINLKGNVVDSVCEAVFILVKELLDIKRLSISQKKMLSSYYFVCVRYYERLNSKNAYLQIKQNLKLFKLVGIISEVNYYSGSLMLILYNNNMISGKIFINVNRKLFKTKIASFE